MPLVFFVKYPETFPSGGKDASEKSTGLLPGNSGLASFFFRYNGSLGVVNGTRIIGETIRFDCKTDDQPSFLPCECNLPKSPDWDMCQQYSGLGLASTIQFSVRVEVLENRNGLFVSKRPQVSGDIASFTWNIGEITQSRQLS